MFARLKRCTLENLFSRFSFRVVRVADVHVAVVSYLLENTVNMIYELEMTGRVLTRESRLLVDFRNSCNIDRDRSFEHIIRKIFQTYRSTKTFLYKTIHRKSKYNLSRG